MGIIGSSRDVLGYRGLIKQLTVRDLKLRYERSALGFLWSLLNPLIMIGVYTFFFSIVMKMGVERYPVFLVSVLLPWGFLSRGVLGVAQVPYQSGYLLNRAAFPPDTLVFSGMLSAFADFCLEMLVLAAILALAGTPIFPGILALPLVMAVHFLFVCGLALLFAVPFVYFRDTQYILNIAVTAWMYLTPVFYPIAFVPKQYQSLYKLNPMVHIANCFRDVIYAGRFPGVATLLVATALAAVTFSIGWAVFNRYKHEFAEIT